MSSLKWFLFFIGTAAFFSGCTPPERYYEPVHVNPVYKDADGKLYFSYAVDDSYFHKGTKLRSLYTLHDHNKSWEKVAIKSGENISTLSQEYNTSKVEELFTSVLAFWNGKNMVNANEHIVYEDGTAIVKHIVTNETIFTDTLPTINDISNAAGINLYDTETRYVPMLNGQLSWDKKSHLASVCTGKNGTKCDDVHIFSLIKNTTGWDINKITSYEEQFVSTGHLFEINDETQLFFDKKIGMVSRFFYSNSNMQLKCYIRDGEEIIQKNIFGEFYPEEYMEMIDKIYDQVVDQPMNYTFDEAGNVHLFYNKREDIKNGNYDYFWYGYFTKENPTTPLYEQKIPWK